MHARSKRAKREHGGQTHQGDEEGKDAVKVILEVLRVQRADLRFLPFTVDPVAVAAVTLACAAIGAPCTPSFRHSCAVASPASGASHSKGRELLASERGGMTELSSDVVS